MNQSTTRQAQRPSFLNTLGMEHTPQIPGILDGVEVKRSSKKIMAGVYAKGELEQLDADIISIISTDIGIQCSEVYDQMDMAGKLPDPIRLGSDKFSYKSFRNHFYAAHKSIGSRAPSQILIIVRLVRKGLSDTDIKKSLKCKASNIARVKTVLGYPGYNSTVTDEVFIKSVKSTHQRILECASKSA